MKNHRDVIIIGSGPAGLSAAVAAKKYGLDVLILDEQPTLGGQIYRNIEKASKERIKLLGPDYRQGQNLVEQFRQSHADYAGNSIVWKIDPKGRLFFSKQGKSAEMSAKAIIIATGAMERPVPFKDWTLPGVMGAGAVDANFKSSGTIPEGPVVLAGSGPLLLLTAGHLISLGVKINAVLDTTPSGSLLTSIPYLPKALKRMDYLLKGLWMLAALKKSGITWIRGVKKYSAHGSNCLDHVLYQTKKRTGQISARILLSHEGIVPRCDFTRQMGIVHLWNPVQRYWYPQTDTFGKIHGNSVYVSGDGAFVHGGVSAALKGELAAIDIAVKLKAATQIQKNEACSDIEKKLSSELAPRPFIDKLYQPHPSLYSLDDDVLICRCEGVTMKEIREALSEGCREANEIKALTRCGMGPCQGRMCGIALSEIIADYMKIEPCDIKPLSIRPPVRNLSLSELSQVSLLEQEA